jgi:hypothetical protein
MTQFVTTLKSQDKFWSAPTLTLDTNDRTARLCRRFVRSVVRVYAVLQASTTTKGAAVHADRSGSGGANGNNNDSGVGHGASAALYRHMSRRAARLGVSPGPPPVSTGTAGKPPTLTGVPAALDCIRSALRQLRVYAVIEIAAAADACVAPVRYGYMKPTNTYSPLSTTAGSGSVHTSSQPSMGDGFWEQTARMLMPRETNEEQTESTSSGGTTSGGHRGGTATERYERSRHTASVAAHTTTSARRREVSD